MKIKLLDKGKFPTKSHKEDIGLDLYLPEKIVLTPFETKTIGLKMCVAIPEGFAGMIVPRSSIAKKRINYANSNYRPWLSRRDSFNCYELFKFNSNI